MEENELQVSLAVNEQLITRRSELERRLYDSERMAKQLRIALSDAQDELGSLQAGRDAENSELKDLRAALQSRDDEVQRLRMELENAAEEAAEADSALQSHLMETDGRQAAVENTAPQRSMIARSTQTIEDEETDLVQQLRNHIVNLENQLAEYEAAEEERWRNQGDTELPNQSMDSTMNETPRIMVPTLNIGGQMPLSATRRSFNPALTDRGLALGGPTPRASAHGAHLSPRDTSRNPAPFATPRMPMAIVQETPRVGNGGMMSEATQLLQMAANDPTAMAKLRDTLATSNIELMMTPRNIPLPSVRATTVPKDVSVMTPSKEGHIFELHPLERGCQLCALLADLDEKFPRVALKSRKAFLGAGWIPDICSRWRQDHDGIWTNEERGIIQSVLEAKPKLRAFPVSRHEGDLFLWRQRNFWKTPWRECFGLIHGVFLYIFPMRDADAELMAAVPLRGSTIKHQTHDGRTNCLSIESLGCGKCVNAQEKMGVEKMIISLSGPSDATRWTSALVEAQRTCAHECSNVFSDVVTLRDLVEQLLREE